MPASSLPPANRRSPWVDPLLSLVLAFGQFRLIALVLHDQLMWSFQASVGVVQGKPHWVVFQSRVLGPYTLDLLSRGLHDVVWANVLFIITMLALAGWAFLAGMERVLGASGKYLAFAVYQLLFALWLNPHWLYSWDLVSLLVFSGFVGLVLCGARDIWLLALFAVALFNRESALFIPLWLVVDEIMAWWRGRGQAAAEVTAQGVPLDGRRMALGVAALVIGVVVIRMLRQTLLVEEVGPQVFHLPQLAGAQVHVQWANNLAFLQGAMLWANHGADLILLLLGLAACACVSWGLRSTHSRLASLSAVHGVMLLAIFLVGVVVESRVFVEFIPYMACALTSLATQGGDRLALESRRAPPQREPDA